MIQIVFNLLHFVGSKKSNIDKRWATQSLHFFTEMHKLYDNLLKQLSANTLILHGSKSDSFILLLFSFKDGHDNEGFAENPKADELQVCKPG